MTVKIARLCLLLFLSYGTLVGQSQAVYTSTDVQRWREKAQLVQKNVVLPLGQRVILVGESFVGIPYVARTLEATPEEQLIVNLRGLDCTTFVESTLALALQPFDTSFGQYCQTLARLRYRHDTVAGYPSRLHYLSDWLFENQRKGMLDIITDQLGGVPYPKLLRFMTTHRKAYRQLQSEANYRALRRVEDSLISRPLLYIPKPQVKRIEPQLQSGDIIAITTNIAGLDASHVGFAVRQGSRIYLLHASSTAGRILISTQPLAEYLLNNSSQTGVMVARLRSQ